MLETIGFIIVVLILVVDLYTVWKMRKLQPWEIWPSVIYDDNPAPFDDPGFREADLDRFHEADLSGMTTRGSS